MSVTAQLNLQQHVKPHTRMTFNPKPLGEQGVNVSSLSEDVLLIFLLDSVVSVTKYLWVKICDSRRQQSFCFLSESEQNRWFPLTADRQRQSEWSAGWLFFCGFPSSLSSSALVFFSSSRLLSSTSLSFLFFSPLLLRSVVFFSHCVWICVKKETERRAGRKKKHPLSIYLLTCLL